MNSQEVAKLWNINITLGDACNLSCKYCFQKGFLDKGVICGDTSISPQVISLLKEIPKLRDPSLEKFKVRFTGGEPLVYFRKLKNLVEQLGDSAKDLHFRIVTNGTLLNEEIVEFFNKYEFEVGISNDGPFSMDTRKVNVLENERLLKLICNIERMHIVCVLNSYTADYEALFNYFKQKLSPHRKSVHAIINPIYNTGHVSDESLFSFDWDTFEKKTEKFFAEISVKDYVNVFTPESYLLSRYLNRVITIDNYAKDGKNILDNISCGADYNHINIDTKGTVLACHNCSKVIGKLEDLSVQDVFDYFYDEKNITRPVTDECKSCEAIIFCNGSCPFVPYSSRAQYYCRLQKIVVGNVLKALLRLERERASYCEKA